MQLPGEGLLLPERSAGDGRRPAPGVSVHLLAPLREPLGLPGARLPGCPAAPAGEAGRNQAQVIGPPFLKTQRKRYKKQGKVLKLVFFYQCEDEPNL